MHLTLSALFEAPKPACCVQSTFELSAAAHLVGLDVGLPKLGVKAPAAGGRQRQQVVAQWPQLLLAKACPPSSPMAKWSGPMSQDNLLKVYILKDMRVSGPRDSAVSKSQCFAGRQHIVQPPRSMTGAMMGLVDIHMKSGRNGHSKVHVCFTPSRGLTTNGSVGRPHPCNTAPSNPRLETLRSS